MPTPVLAPAPGPGFLLPVVVEAVDVSLKRVRCDVI